MEDQNASLAKNEALYRRVNERIESISDQVPRDEQTMDFVCECDRPGCFEKVTATRAEYESVRSVSTHFIVHNGPSRSRASDSGGHVHGRERWAPRRGGMGGP